MKILHLLTTNKFSGAENVVCQIINLFESKIKMVYCSPEGPIRASLKERNVEFIPLKDFTISEIRRAIKIFNPDCIHAHDIRASVLSAIATSKIPIISHIHGKAEELTRLTIKSFLYRITIHKYQTIIAVSKSILNEYYFKKKLKTKSTVLYNVINKEILYEKVSQDKNEYEFDGVYLGRFVYPKNPQRLIKILAKVIEKRSISKFALVGDRELLDECQALAKKLGIFSNLCFKGFMSNPYKLLHGAKVMIMTSRAEGTPICLLEAMLLGVPIISTPIDGVKELLEDGWDGFYSHDDDYLVDSILKLLSNSELRNEFSTRILEKGLKLNNLDNYKDSLHKIYLNKVEM